MDKKRCEVRLTEKESIALEALSKDLGISRSAVLKLSLYGGTASVNSRAAFVKYMNICRSLEKKDYTAVAEEVFSLCGLFNSSMNQTK